MTSPGRPPSVNGWRLYAHPVFLGQLDALVAQVQRAKEKDPIGYRMLERGNPPQDLDRLLAAARALQTDEPD